jgi:hypothetical protein
MAIIEIDYISVDGEGVADLSPVVLIARNVLRFTARNRLCGRPRFLDSIVLKGCQGDGSRSNLAKVAAIHDVSPCGAV